MCVCIEEESQRKLFATLPAMLQHRARCNRVQDARNPVKREQKNAPRGAMLLNNNAERAGSTEQQPPPHGKHYQGAS